MREISSSKLLESYSLKYHDTYILFKNLHQLKLAFWFPDLRMLLWNVSSTIAISRYVTQCLLCWMCCSVANYVHCDTVPAPSTSRGREEIVAGTCQNLNLASKKQDLWSENVYIFFRGESSCAWRKCLSARTLCSTPRSRICNSTSVQLPSTVCPTLLFLCSLLLSSFFSFLKSWFAINV